MKSKLLMAVLVAGSSWNYAQTVTYPSLNISYSIPGSTASTLTTGSVNLSTSPDHRFLDPDTATPSVSATRYYGGSIAWTGSSNEWGSTAVLRIGSAGSPGDHVLLRVGGGLTNWQITASSFTANTTLPFSSSSFDFVIKIADAAWNTASVNLFLGANANTALEGTPDYTIQLNNATGANFLGWMSWTTSHENWDVGASSLVTNNMFSSTVWTPVSAIPEPSTYMLMVGGIGLLAWLRRRTVRRGAD